MVIIENPAIPEGSTVLVTGVNGFIASHVADQFVQQGYNVRGTVRNIEKSAWISSYFDKTYGKGRLELFSVPDMTAENAYDQVAEGVSAFIHVASVVSFDPDASKVIPLAVGSTEVAIKAAYEQQTVKRFVLTSSSSAAIPSGGLQNELLEGESPIVTEETWNSKAVELAWRPGPWGPEQGGIVYSASKTEQERFVWKYYQQNHPKRPDLVVNAVLPHMNLGKSLDPANQGHPSTSGIVAAMMHGHRSPPELGSQPQYFIDVQDDGLLHVAAAVLPDVRQERIFGFAQPFNYDRILDILRKQNPDKSFHENYASGEYPFVIKPRERAEELLRRLGKSGWTSLEDSVLRNTEDIRAAGAA